MFKPNEFEKAIAENDHQFFTKVVLAICMATKDDPWYDVPRPSEDIEWGLGTMNLIRQDALALNLMDLS